MKEKKEEERHERGRRVRVIDNAIGGDLVGRCSKVLFVFIPGLCSCLETHGAEGGASSAREREKKNYSKTSQRGERSTSRYGTIRRFGRKNTRTILPYFHCNINFLLNAN